MKQTKKPWPKLLTRNEAPGFIKSVKEKAAKQLRKVVRSSIFRILIAVYLRPPYIKALSILSRMMESALNPPILLVPPSINQPSKLHGASRIEKLVSCGGHGTLEILQVVKVLEDNGISCCLVETSALIYYGANRTLGVGQVTILWKDTNGSEYQDWHIGVRTSQLLDAPVFLNHTLIPIST